MHISALTIIVSSLGPDDNNITIEELRQRILHIEATDLARARALAMVDGVERSAQNSQPWLLALGQTLVFQSISPLVAGFVMKEMTAVTELGELPDENIPPIHPDFQSEE